MRKDKNGTARHDHQLLSTETRIINNYKIYRKDGIEFANQRYRHVHIRNYTSTLMIRREHNDTPHGLITIKKKKTKQKRGKLAC